MGVEEVIGPQTGWKEDERERGTGRDDGRKSGDAAMRVGDGRLGVTWTVAYYVLLVAGAVGFWKELWPLTESARRLAEV